MHEPADNLVTQLLVAIGQGEAGSRDKLLEAISDQLRAMACNQMANEAAGHLLQPTALVHEAYLRLFGGGQVSFENRRHFFGAAAEAMRRILVDDARMRKRLKRNPHAAAESLDSEDLPTKTLAEPAASASGPHAVPAEQAAWLDHDRTRTLDLEHALKHLESLDGAKAEVVKQHYFLGMSIDEIAEIQGVSPRTVDLWLRFAKALLRKLLADGYGSERPEG